MPPTCHECDGAQQEHDTSAIINGSVLLSTVTFELLDNAALGVKLRAPRDGVVRGGLRVEGVENVELEGRVKPGDQLVEIGGRDLDGMGFADAVGLFRELSRPLVVKFQVDEMQRATARPMEEFKLTPYVVAFDEGPMGINLGDAEGIGIQGAVVRAIKGQAKTGGQVAVGDMVSRVNRTSVLGMSCAQVKDVLRLTPPPKTLQFVPKNSLADVEKFLSRQQETTPEDENNDAEGFLYDHESIVQLIQDNRSNVIKKGRLHIQNTATGDWKLKFVVLRLSKIEILKSVSSNTSREEISFVGPRCSVRALLPTEALCESKWSGKQFLLEVGEQKLVVACESESDTNNWMDALNLAIDTSKEMHRVDKMDLSKSELADKNASEDLNAHNDVLQEEPNPEDPPSPLDLKQVELLQHLLSIEKRLRKAAFALMAKVLHDEIKLKVHEVAVCMAKIGSLDVPHPDPEVEHSRRQEYIRLEQDLDKFNTAILLKDEYEAEKALATPQWEEENHAANLEALKAIRRCMPVCVKNLSEAELQTQKSPNGKMMARELARKFKRTNVLELLRRDPKDVAKSHPSLLENLRVTGLTVTERRALHLHLRDLGETWRSEQDNELTKRKYDWFKTLEDVFELVVDAYNKHVEQFGPAGNHPHVAPEHPEIGCPLVGKQCPIMADMSPSYTNDLGYPEGDVYMECTVQKGSPDDAGAYALREAQELAHPEVSRYAFDGFLVEKTLGSLSEIRDHHFLHSKRLDSTALTKEKLEFSTGISELWRGQYQSRVVAIKRLAEGEQTLANVIAFSSQIKGFARIFHENIVAFIGVEWGDGLETQAVFEWLELGDLRTLLASSQVDSSSWGAFKCEIAIDVVSGLEHMWKQHMWNRSITLLVPTLTSRKVFLDKNGRAKINLLSCSDLLRDRMFDSIRWVAPEVLKGEKVTQRATVYSVGVLLWELDTTKLPYGDVVNPNGSPVENELIAQQVITGTRSLPPFSDECPEPIKSLGQQCLSYDFESRPSLMSVAYALREILKNDL